MTPTRSNSEAQGQRLCRATLGSRVAKKTAKTSKRFYKRLPPQPNAMIGNIVKFLTMFDVRSTKKKMVADAMARKEKPLMSSC